MSDDVTLPVSAWSGVELIEPVDEGNRNEVWRGTLAGESVAVRRSRRSPASLEWELSLIGNLHAAGFVVPTVVTADDGSQSIDGVVVQRWIEGRPPSSDADWHAVAAELRRLHALTPQPRQRPDCCVVTELSAQRTSVDADLDAIASADRAVIESVFETFVGVPTSVIHGDPDPSNIRITADGQVGLLDWDESRVDVVFHDLSNLGVRVLDVDDHERAQDLSNAWEATNAWTAEPLYATSRMQRLRQRRSAK